MLTLLAKLSNKISNCLMLISNLRLNNTPTTLSIQAMFMSTVIIQAICGLTFLWATNKLGVVIYLILRGLLTNWIHEDALSDCFDSNVKHNIKTRLNLLKIPTIGTYGTSILTSTILLEYTLLSRINPNKLPMVCTICSSIGYFSMMYHWHTTPHAYNSKYYQPISPTLFTWLLLLLIISLIRLGFIQTILLSLTNLSLVLVFNLWSLHKFGGHTGNTIGAVKKLSELLSLISMTS
ncbi:Adenosylcobinamide-GDP ribazoletransferase [Candidatus Hodgkinia cicadicola]|uniref:Adenosylcobinamide-GDP ribazoletransferase n=1 Tax=Candidatus Hodgkinia cicadicola TaxID=573658 RepID=A0ABX4MHL3_9HYPH|nr:Adenosylcobinamide-GDP ribazoletransferase [Candidatus Hodgkinia cicadicola]